MLTTRGGPPQRRQGGVALVAMLLLTAVVLLVVVATASSLTRGARGGSADERRGYQALLAAESGLNTLPVRLAEYRRARPLPPGPGAGSPSPEALTGWLEGFRASPLGTPPLAEYAFTRVQGAGGVLAFTATSRSRQEGAARTVAQDFRTLPHFPLRARAALTSRPAVQAGAGLVVGGLASQGPAGTVDLTSVHPAPVLYGAAAPSVQLAVTSSEGVFAGDYLSLNAGGPAPAVFRVDTVGAGTLGLTLVEPAALGASMLAGRVRLVVNALAAPLGPTDVGTPDGRAPVRVTHAGDFVEGERVNVGGRAAVVQRVDAAAGTLTLDWPDGPPGALPEGTPVVRDVAAVRSAQSISAEGNLSLNGPGCGPAGGCLRPEDELLRADDFSLTRQLLGLSDAELDALYPLAPAGAGLPQGGVARLSAAQFGALFQTGARGSGVLIVDGDVGATGPGPLDFDGLIYLRGQLSAAPGLSPSPDTGLRLRGALAVRGGLGAGMPDDRPTVPGAWSLSYDVPRLRQAAADAAGAGFAAVPGTWRQR